jgi:hypothetical protein
MEQSDNQHNIKYIGDRLVCVAHADGHTVNAMQLIHIESYS